MAGRSKLMLCPLRVSFLIGLISLMCGINAAYGVAMCCAPFPGQKVKVTRIVYALPLFKSKHSFIDSSQPHSKEWG